ncbi:MAG TPA: ABC transporter ATP-binding protein [Gemmatimonadota bacterium]|jgi:putative ABC transport system ATP-binding protein|nr:ABC transporter ATP-binding protein [Gemmatimonadota bacterium]
MEIACNDLVKRFVLDGRTVSALDGISCGFTSGELTVVIGRSGSGKTTLLNLLGGLDRPTSGRVEVDGEDLYARSDRALSRYRNERIGFVFQSFHLNGRETALENVLVPFLFARHPPGDRKDRGRAALAGVELADQVDQPAGTLSAGQRQRVAIARALVNEPDFVLADEPTGNLDQETGAGIIGHLESLAHERGLGVVIVTHDPGITGVADRILRLENGRLL